MRDITTLMTTPAGELHCDELAALAVAVAGVHVKEAEGYEVALQWVDAMNAIFATAFKAGHAAGIVQKLRGLEMPEWFKHMEPPDAED